MDFGCGLPASAVKPCSSGRKPGERRRRIQFYVSWTRGLCRTRLDGHPREASPSMDSEVRHVQHRIPSGVVLGDRRPGPVVVAPAQVEEVAHGADALQSVAGAGVGKLGLPQQGQLFVRQAPPGVGSERPVSGTPSPAGRRTGRCAPSPGPAVCRRPRGTRAAGWGRAPAG